MGYRGSLVASWQTYHRLDTPVTLGGTGAGIPLLDREPTFARRSALAHGRLQNHTNCELIPRYRMARQAPGQGREAGHSVSAANSAEYRCVKPKVVDDLTLKSSSTVRGA
jgi:hypothetical protein